MENKICLITGANAGIGKTTALGLANKGARIILLCRNEQKGLTARDEIRKRSGNGQAELVVADLSSQASIRAAAARISAEYPHLDVLINNAGAFLSNFQHSAEGIEMQFAVNHIGHFLLSHLLLDKLQAAPAPRLINVSSGSHYGGKIDFDSFIQEPTGGYSSWQAYSQSKLANILFTYEFTRRFPKIMTNALHPGVVRTEIGGKSGSLLAKVLWTAFKPFMLSAKQGAKTTLFLASSDDVTGVTRKYFEKCREKRSAELSYDEALARKLWEKSEELCGISFGE